MGLIKEQNGWIQKSDRMSASGSSYDPPKCHSPKAYNSRSTIAVPTSVNTWMNQELIQISMDNFLDRATLLDWPYTNVVLLNGKWMEWMMFCIPFLVSFVYEIHLCRYLPFAVVLKTQNWVTYCCWVRGYNSKHPLNIPENSSSKVNRLRHSCGR